MLLLILVVLATATITAGSDLLDISGIVGSPHLNNGIKERVIDRDNKTFYHSKFGNSVKYIHFSLTGTAIVKQVVILNR